MKKGLVGRLIGLCGVSSCGKTTVLRRLVKRLQDEGKWKLGGFFNCETGEPCGESDYVDFAAVLSRKGKVVVIFTEGDYSDDPERLGRFCEKMAEKFSGNVSAAVVAMRVCYPNVLHQYVEWASQIDVDMTTILKRKDAVPDDNNVSSCCQRLVEELDRS